MVYIILKKIYRKIKTISETMLIIINNLRIKNNLSRVRNYEDKKIKVIFFAMNSSMWKYDSLYRLMKQGSSFEPHIVFAPSPSASINKEMIANDKKLLGDLFKDGIYNFISEYDCINNIGIKGLAETIDPDVIFYTKPYREEICKEYWVSMFPRALICYSPYAIFMGSHPAGFDLLFHSLSWKMFYPCKEYIEMFSAISRNKGKNIVVSGYPMWDVFFDKARPFNDPWKKGKEGLKRIIWAPHHSIIGWQVQLSSFLVNYEFIFDLTKIYRDKIQIAFKPHPHLKTVLYNLPEWGKEKTDNYYKDWDELENGQYVDGDYVDLFLTSDGMIHDCVTHKSRFYIYMMRQVNLMLLGTELMAFIIKGLQKTI
jgi:hypothetical protein